jgi:heme/copper-type cytochrome/quinol oxidase subunit 2
MIAAHLLRSAKMKIQQPPKSQRVLELVALLIVTVAVIGVIIFYFGFYMYAYERGMPRAQTPERLVSIIVWSAPFVILASACLSKIRKLSHEPRG